MNSSILIGIAPAIVIGLPPAIAPAKTIPTDAPSGILWIVTANISIVDFFQLLLIPSCSSLFKCKWGTARSKTSRKTIPSKNPAAAVEEVYRGRFGILGKISAEA